MHARYSTKSHLSRCFCQVFLPRYYALLPSPVLAAVGVEKNLERGWGCVSLVLMKRSEILKARKHLVQELADPAEILRGSLLDRKVFHRRGCLKCRRGEGHRVGFLRWAIREVEPASSAFDPNKGSRSSSGCGIIKG